MLDGDVGAERALRFLAGEPAERFAAEHIFKPLGSLLKVEPERDAIAAALADPWMSLRVLYGHFAFAKRGKERESVSQAAVLAASKIQAETPDFLSLGHGAPMWRCFTQIQESAGRKTQTQGERGLVQGLAELAQEVFREEGKSIASWVWDGADRDGAVARAFERLVEIRGVGPKLGSLFLRDLILLSGQEDRIHPSDRLYLLPVDRWMRIAAPMLIEELSDSDAADWVLAGKIAKHTRRAKVSGIRFNMGVSYLGLRSGSSGLFEASLRRIMGSDAAKDFSAVPFSDR